MNNKTPIFEAHPRPYYPWVIWILCVFLNFYKFLLKAGTLTIETSLLGENTLRIEGTTTFIDSYFYAVVIFQLPIAFLIDRYGPRRMSSLGLLIAALGAILMGMTYFPFLRAISLIMMGLGGSVAIINALKLISNWFNPRQFALMAGLTVMIGIFGASIGYPLTLKLVESFGWRQGMVDYGIIGILYALLFFLIIRDSEPGARYNINPPSKEPFWKAIRKALSSGENWVIGLYIGFLLAPWSTFIGVWQAPFLEVAHKVDGRTAMIINLFNIIGFAIGAPILAWLSTRSGRRKPFLYLGPIIALLLVLPKIYIPGLSHPFLMIISFISSFFAGAYVVGYATIHEKNLPMITATVIGMALVVNGVFRIVEDHLINFFLTKGISPLETAFNLPYQSYAKAFLIIPISLILSLVCAFFIKESHCMQKYEE